MAGSRKLAGYAVRHVYQFCSSRPRKEPGSYRNFMLDTRDRIAERFRQEHGSCAQTPVKANVYPYFIGVFDTVAALGRTAAVIILAAAFAAIVFVFCVVISLLSDLSDAKYVGWLLEFLSLEHVSSAVWGAIIVAGIGAYLKNYVKFDFRVPGYGFWKSLATFHLAPRKHTFTDHSLNVNVSYAKHAISIDENRSDFKRVPWVPNESKVEERDDFGNLYFEQVWFAGVHADVGGGYPENESRLSDITLRWMLAAASLIPHGIHHDGRVSSFYPDPAGPQHDEYKAGNWQYSIRDLPVDKATRKSEAPMHKSVYARFETGPVVQYDAFGCYRPDNLRRHVDFEHYFTGGSKPAGWPGCVADDIEFKWEQVRANRPG